jgi:WD40 repeat protein
VENPEGWTIRDASNPGSVVRKIPLAGRIRCWALSPDGLWLVLGGDGGARVWDVETGEAVTGLLGHAGGVRSVDFSPEGSRLVTGGVDGVVKVWDLRGIRAMEKRVTLSGRVINQWRSFEAYPAAVGVDRQLVLAVRQDGRQTAVQVDLDTGREQPMPDYPGSLTCGAVLSGHTAGVWAIYDPEADPPSSSPQVGLWRQTGKTWKWTRLPHPVRVVGAAFDASDSRLVTLDASNGLRSWDVSRGALLFQTNLPGALGNAIMSKGAARWVQLGESNRVVTVSRLDGREVGTSTVRLEGAVDGMGISPDAGRLSLAMRDGSLRVLNLESAQSQRLPSGWLPTPVAMEWDGRGSRLIVQAGAGTAQIVDFRADAIQSVAGTGGGFPRTRVTFGQEDGWAVVRGEDESVWVIDVASGHPVSRKLRHAGRVRFSTVTRGGQWVTVSDPDQVWMGRMDPASDSVETLQRHARLGAGRQISRSGKLDWIEVPALIAMAGGAGQQGEAGTESQRLAAWQWERAGRPRTLLQAEAARFHLGQLGKGSNSAAEGTRRGTGEMETSALPDRFPGMDRRLVDLSVFYTHSFPGLADRPLASLPVGPSRIGSVDYDLRGLIRLEPAVYAGQLRAGGLVAPDSVPLTRCAGIPIQQTCRRIHFLMGSDGPLARMDHPVARWRIRYEGDAVREFPVVYGRQVYEWTSNPLSGKPGQVPHIAWMGRMPAPNGEQQAHLYAVEWENPEPGRKVAALDFVLGEENCRPFVVAITVE